MSLWLLSEVAQGPFAETTGPLLARFPNSKQLLAYHAVALYRDERFTEAFDAIVRLRAAGTDPATLLDKKAVALIDKSHPLLSERVTAARALKFVGPDVPPCDDSLVDLLADREALERKLTELFTQHVAENYPILMSPECE